MAHKALMAHSTPEPHNRLDRCQRRLMAHKALMAHSIPEPQPPGPEPKGTYGA
jgi:hypothetical protein